MGDDGRGPFLFMAALALTGALVCGAVVLWGAGEPAAAGPLRIRLAAEHLPREGDVLILPDLPVAVVRRADGALFALALRCPYLACVPAWEPETGVFRCPCHGASFGPDGAWRTGPAPSHLPRHLLRRLSDGLVEIDRTVVFPMIGRFPPPDVQYPISLVLNM